MPKEDFKKFVRSHPNLINYVNNGSKTWQQFYEMYDIYGENNSVWKDYLIKKNDVTNKTTKKKAAGTNDDILSTALKASL